MSNLNQVVMAAGRAGVRFQRWNQQDLLMGRMGGSREVRRVDPEVLGLIQLSPTGAGKKRHHGNWTSYTQASNFSMIFTNPPLPARRLRPKSHSSHFTKKTILRILREIEHLAQGHTANKWQTLDSNPGSTSSKISYLFSYTRKSKVWRP